MWIDTHSHLESVENLESVLVRAKTARVERIVTLGSDIVTSRQALQIASEHPEVLAAVGIHPNESSGFDEEALAEVDRMAGAPEVVAIGESGLDYYREFAPQAMQMQAFARHADLARRLGKALVIHIRGEAYEDTFRILEENGPPERIVFHAFSGNRQQAHRSLELGGYLSLGGYVTYKGSEDLVELVSDIPMDRLLIETDSPFLTPLPHRGKPNEPSYVTLVGDFLAKCLGKPPEVVAQATTANAKRVFGFV